MFELRPYQQIIYNKIIDCIKNKQKKILVLGATGFGKTILAHEIAKNAIAKNNRVLFTNHRIALAEQTFKKFSDLNAELLQGENKLQNQDAMLIVASLQTLINSEIPEPKIIIIDECHYGYEGNLVQSLFEKYPNAFFIGLSATPVDDKDKLLEGWDSILDDYQTKDLIEMKQLTPFVCFAPVSLDLSHLKIKNNDYHDDDVLEVIEKENINQSVISEYQKKGENRSFICFAQNKKHCIELKYLFDAAGIKTEIIDANTSSKNREKYILDLKNGIIKGLISIEILTAGFDEPKVSCVILANVTAQWKKYIQCVGRGIRLDGKDYQESILKGKKDCILLDFGSNIERHGMPDDRKVFKFGKKISRVIDKQLGLDVIESQTKKQSLSVEKQVYLQKIGSILDLYENKVYSKESDLQDDVNKFLEKTNYFWWRQNSGKMFKDGRWIHFASKAGLPDNSVFYGKTSFFFGLELKLKHGRLTDKQIETLPEMTQNNILFFICESVFDVYLAIEHVEKNIVFDDDCLKISNKIYQLEPRQIELRQKLKIPLYENHL
jgi:superfamily II DNA or RNA helicase